MEDVLECWRSEKTAGYLSAAVAAAEPDPGKAALFREMADAAEEQAGILAKELHETPPFKPSLRSRLTAFLIRTFGPRAMRPILSASKVRGVSVYSGKVQTGHSWPTSVEDVGRRHKSHGGGTLRAGVFGVNDGLVSNTCGRRRGRAFRPHLDRRSRAARRRLLHGRRRVHLHALAKGNVRASDRAGARRARALSQGARRRSLPSSMPRAACPWRRPAMSLRS